MLQGCEVLLDEERRDLEVDEGVQGVAVEGGDQALVLELQEELREARHSGGGDEMADIGFDGPQGAESPVLGMASKKLGRGLPPRWGLRGWVPVPWGLDVGQGAGVDPEASSRAARTNSPWATGLGTV